MYIGASEMLFSYAPHVRCAAVNIFANQARDDEAENALRILCADQPALTFKAMRDAMQEIRGQMISMYALLLGIVFVLGLVGVMNLINTRACQVKCVSRAPPDMHNSQKRKVW